MALTQNTLAHLAAQVQQRRSAHQQQQQQPQYQPQQPVRR